MANLVRETFYCSSTWVAPAGVTSVKVIKTPRVLNTVNYLLISSQAINCCCDLYSWGVNTCGALGVGTITTSCQPICVCCAHKYCALACNDNGPNTVIAIDTTGAAYGWGDNSQGVLGIGTNTLQCLPQPICCGIKWQKIQISANTGVLSMAGIDNNGCMWASGSNQCGQLGIGSITNQCQPQPVCCGIIWKDFVYGDSSSVYAIDATGSLYAWGKNVCGALGVGSITAQCKPQPVCCGLKWVKVFTRGQSVFGITCTNDLYAWGLNDDGSLGLGNTTSQCKPQPVCCGLKWMHIAVNGSAVNCQSVIGLTTSNQMYAWGTGICGILGIGTTDVAQCQPQLVCCGLTVKCVYTYTNHNAYAITTGNDLYAWGNNSAGALGINSQTAQCLPQPVCCGLKWDRLVGQNQRVTGITTLGCAFSWGCATSGSGGYGSTTAKCQPTPVCCNFIYFPTPQPDAGVSFSVTPGFTYYVTVNGLTQGFCNSYNVSNDIFAQAVVIEYFQ